MRGASDRPAAIDGERLPGGERRQIAGEIAHHFGDFLRLAKAAHRLAGLERGEGLVVVARCGEAVKPAGKRGRPPIGLERMLRMYVAQQCFGLSDEGAEDALYDSQAIRAFVGIDLSREAAPDATTLLKFRRLLEKHQLTKAIFQVVNDHLEDKGLLLRQGTIVDASIIAAPPSTKNRDKARDPEMHQTRKGKQWCVSRTQVSGLWCCTEDGRWPPEVGLQEQASNRPVLRRLKGVVVSDRGKVTH